MTQPNFRALCAELIKIVEEHCNPDEYALSDTVDTLRCARAALATPPPEPPTSQITFNAPSPPEEVIRLDKEGFHYKGQFVADAGEAHRLMMAFLEQNIKTKPKPPTDEEIQEWADACSEAPLEEMDPDVHGWRRCFTAKEFSETIRAALERWGHA